MSSRPPPASPISQSDASPPSPMSATQRLQLGPIALPPPPSAHAFESSPRHLPPVYPTPASLAAPALSTLQAPYDSASNPPRHAAPGRDERWSAAPLGRLLSTQTFTPPISNPSYSPRFTFSVPPRAELGSRPTSQIPESSLINSQRREYTSYPTADYEQAPSHKAPYRSSTPTALPRIDTSIASEPAAVPRETTSISSSRYEIKVRQQPLAARACGFGERDRRVIDPPPIVQLTVRESPEASADELRYPFNVVHCTLWNVSGTTDETALQSQDRKITRRLMGTLVSSPFVGVDEDDKEGCFFCFPDLSCRTNGRYRLRFVLMRIEANEAEPGGYTPILTQITSDVFTVYTAKDFPGMRASTALTKALKRQGCAISVKKGNDKANFHKGDDDSGDSAEVQEQGGRPKKRRKV